MSQAAAIALDGAPQRLRVPLLARLMSEVTDQERVVVLNLGGCSHGLVNMLSAYQACLHVVDLPSEINAIRQVDRDAPGAAKTMTAVLDALLPDLRDEPADLLLCWNLLNYMDTVALQGLAAALSSRLRSTARLHAVMEYATEHMASEPALWTPDVGTESLDEARVDHVLVTAAGHASMPAPRYTPRQLEGLLAGFKIDATMLLSNGMQEHLFKRAPDAPEYALTPPS